MKVLLAVLAVLLALGAGAFLVTMDSGGGGRGAKDGRRSTRAERAEGQRPTADEVVPGGAPLEEPRAAPAPVERPTRQEMGALDVPEARGVFEGTLIGDGEPIPGANVTLVRGDEVLAEGQTDPRGKFRLECAPLAAAATLRVDARGFASLERALSAKPAGGLSLLGNLRVLRGQRIEGRVLDGAGRGVADAALRVEQTNPGSDVLMALGKSGPDGAFEIADAPPATVLVTARAQGFGETTARYTANSGALEIRLAPGHELVLLLAAPRGRSVAGAEVTIQALDDPRQTKKVARSDDSGRILFEGLGSSAWSVRVTHPEFRPAGKNKVQANGVEQTIECAPWPAIEGVVRAPGGAAPPPGTRVQALPASAPADRIAELPGGFDVDAEGRFRITGLRAGEWRVRASAPGFAPASSNAIKLGIESDGYAGTIELRAGAELALVVTLDSEPLAGAEVELFPSAPSPAQLFALHASRGDGAGRRARSGADGRARIENLPAGPAWVAVYAEGCMPQSSGPHEPGGKPVAVALERGARVVGRVLESGGAPAAHAQLRIVEEARRLGFPLTLAADEEGRYTSAWLPPGRYTIEAFASDDATRRTGATELELAAGDERSLDLRL